MQFRPPKNTSRLSWTRHSIEKMKYYGLSWQRINRVLKNPQRVEEGIAPGTIAIMQKIGSKKRPSEIWVMYQKINQKRAPHLNEAQHQSRARCWTSPAPKRSFWCGVSGAGSKIPEGKPFASYGAGKNQKERLRIISCWRYPGRSPLGKKIPVPEEIREEVEKIVQELKRQ